MNISFLPHRVFFAIYSIWLLVACDQSGVNDRRQVLLDACYYRVEGSEKCGTSFPRLMINPESARGKEVVIAGFLAPRAGVALLYASEQDYLNGEVFNAVEIKGRDLSLLDEKWYRWVRIRAEFGRSTGEMLLGSEF